MSTSSARASRSSRAKGWLCCLARCSISTRSGTRPTTSRPTLGLRITCASASRTAASGSSWRASLARTSRSTTRSRGTSQPGRSITWRSATGTASCRSSARRSSGCARRRSRRRHGSGRREASARLATLEVALTANRVTRKALERIEALSRAHAAREAEVAGCAARLRWASGPRAGQEDVIPEPIRLETAGEVTWEVIPGESDEAAALASLSARRSRAPRAERAALQEAATSRAEARRSCDREVSDLRGQWRRLQNGRLGTAPASGREASQRREA